MQFKTTDSTIEQMNCNCDEPHAAHTWHHELTGDEFQCEGLNLSLEERFFGELCRCGERRDQHDFDADLDEGRWVPFWGVCTVEGCGCLKFEGED